MISQVLLNGILAGLTWSLVALGFTVVYSTANFIHAAYAATFLAGAYAGIVLSGIEGLPLVACAMAAIATAVLLGLIIEVAVYRPLRTLGSSSLVLFLASLAVLIITENLVALIFGSEIRVPGRSARYVTQVLGARATTVQLWSGVIAIGLFVATSVFARVTSLGRQMRAVASDPELAVVVGIDRQHVLLAAMCIGSALSGASGFLLTFDTSATPFMGFTVLLIGVTAAIVGGIGTIAGAMLGGLLVGIAQHVGAWILPAQWQDAVVFSLLLLFLFIRPQGFLGRPVRKVTV